MNAAPWFRLIQRFQPKYSQYGFNLAGFTVMTSVIACLSTITWTSLASQAAKTRNTELYSTVIKINRAQQRHHMMYGQFARDVNSLSIINLPQTYQSAPPQLSADQTALVSARVTTYGETAKNGTLAYSGMVAYDPNTNTYSHIICQSAQPADTMLPPQSTSQCPDRTMSVR